MTGPQRPRVWLDLDQSQLDVAYSQGNYASNMTQVLDRFRIMSDAVRARSGPPVRVAYGPGEIESLNIFVAANTPAPVQIFIHGGAWHSETAAAYAFLADCFVDAGVHLVVPDFSWVQNSAGGLNTVVEQLRRAIAWTHGNIGRFGGDASRMYISGHSSGAHLAAVLLTIDWQKEFDLPHDLFKGGLCCSGVFDLEPVRLSSRNDYLALTDEMEQRLSPIRHLDHLYTPLIVAHGDGESPEFIRQSGEFVAAISLMGKAAELIEVAKSNHFEILESLADPLGILGRAALDQIGA